VSRGGALDGRQPRGDRPHGQDRAPVRPESRPRLPRQALTLPGKGGRRPVARVSGRPCSLRDSEAELLATVGAFRVVPVGDLERDRPAESVRAEVRRLIDERLLESKTVPIDGRSTPVVALTREGKQLLEGLRAQESGARAQQYHAGFVKPRELAHDAQLYGVYRAEAARIEAEGGTPTRVVLDYELKREYQAYLNRPGRPEEESLDEARAAFAETHGLPVVDGHLELPDVRVEYQTADGEAVCRDLELVTEHYSRAQLAGKARAGFTAYGAGKAGGRLSGGAAHTGGTAFNPHALDWLR
jgi:hypothetical protein